MMSHECGSTSGTAEVPFKALFACQVEKVFKLPGDAISVVGPNLALNFAAPASLTERPCKRGRVIDALNLSSVEIATAPWRLRPRLGPSVNGHTEECSVGSIWQRAPRSTGMVDPKRVLTWRHTGP